MKPLTYFLYRTGMVYGIMAILLFVSCNKDDDSPGENGITGPDLAMYALTNSNMLLSLNANNPSAILNQKSISGLQAGESLLGIDFRPATGQLYGVGSSSRIYVLNPQTGAARAIGAAAFTPAINGTAIGLDFNPTVDRLRLVTSTGQNLRLNPETGGTAGTDGNLNGVSNPNVTAAAYTSNRAGAASTVLFVIDVATDKLYKQDPPNDGKLVEVGSIGFDVEQAGDFDISPDGKAALAALKTGGKTNLYAIDITTGKATKILREFSSNIISVAIPTEPVAYAISSTNELVIFNPLNPAQVNKPITGLVAGEAILGLDFRPVNGQLYALGSTSRLYTINAASGAATVVSAAPFSTLLAGTDFGFDFNPMVDRIRIVSNTGQNMRLVPTDGTVAGVDVTLTPGTALITAAAYNNNIAAAPSTILFDIDAVNNRLYKQDPPNNGTLVSVGPLGVTATAANGFDIGSTSGTAYALLTVGGVTRVYTINLTTGTATAGATISGTIKGFTIGLGF
ncbi:protein of unknown function [Chitinophaga jiangningensis]|uniref:DUF4394 domain-containing protein n=1 Tax=Chitinophaga jiangningensis TaxID=1419482 RepID=A0A1M7JC64_9BACT|nr:DUF4394 domain-containing protein [Chitinophaga jiangningensis]SHM50511.1 protein of unknown function [Chitinophaga jiangningensis]